jgi:hypothetical protein
MKYTIYCDLDGVLVDFAKGYEELTGVNIEGQFLSGSDFWAPINIAGAQFWANLDWMEDGKQLWYYIKKHKPTLLSAPSKDPSSEIGKKHWVMMKLPKRDYNQLILTPSHEKKKYANENSILIDDLPKNISDWKDAGGIAIHHKSTVNTIAQLKKLGL